MVSRAHEELVEMILNWLDPSSLAPDAQIFTDGVGILGSAKPQKIGGYVPDVLCRIPSSARTIIGDGKTPNDLKSRHSKDQLEAFATYLAQFGKKGEIVIATRFQWAPRARRILNNLPTVRKHGYPRVRVLCEFGEWS